MAQVEGQASIGCSVCRSRKVRQHEGIYCRCSPARGTEHNDQVKCDRKTPSCRNCDRLRIQCPGYGTPPTHGSRDDLHSSVENIYRASGVERRRVGSCEECRRVKSRCSRRRPVCHRCSQKQLRCYYPSKFDLRGNQESRTSPVSPTRGRMGGVSSDSSADQRQAAGDKDLDWLCAESCPRNRDHLRVLANIYFDRISTLRCLGFVHKPSFFQALDRGTLNEEYGEPLVHIISALGAQLGADYVVSIYYSDSDEGQSRPSLRTRPGQVWAEKAQSLVMSEIACPSLTTLMTLILICEYAMSTEQHALAFMILGICYRTLRLLGLDVPGRSSSPRNPLERTQVESGRRLLWSCYILDSFIGAGVDENLEWKGDSPRIPLPCLDYSFMAQIQPPEQYLPLPECIEDLGSLNLRSQTIYLAQLRTRVLRLIRSSNSTKDISDKASPFLELVTQLEAWRSRLPDQLTLSDLNIYVLEELSILGAVFMLHFFYHSIACDLTRVSLPGFDFPLATAFRTAPAAFRKQVQERCRFHADEVSRLACSALAHGKQVFDDPHCWMAAFESTKIQIVHTATATLNSPFDRGRASENIQVNLKMLNMARSRNTGPNKYHRALLPLLARFGFHNILSAWQDWTDSVPTYDNEAEVTGPADAAYLSNLAPFRLAKSNVEARAQRLSTSIGSEANSPVAVERQPPIISPSQVEPVQIGADHNLDPSYEMIGLPPTPNEGALYTNQSSAALGNVAASVGASEFSVDEYARVATEMTGYITWDLSELSTWPDFGGHPSRSNT